MIKLICGVDGSKMELKVEGEANKGELYLLLGMLDDLKYKLLSSTQDDGAEIIVAKRGKK